MTELNNYILILIYGSLLMLSIILLANPLGVNRKANFYFGLFLALWSSYWIEEIFSLCGIQVLGDFSNFCLLFLQLFVPILFYLSVLYYTQPNFKAKLRDLVYFVAPTIVLLDYVISSLMNIFVLSSSIIIFLTLGQAFTFIFLSYSQIRKHKEKINLFNSNTERNDLRWLEFIIFALLALSVFIGLYNTFFSGGSLNVFANVFVLFIIYFVGYHSIRQTEIFTISADERELVIEAIDSVDNSRKKLISDKELDTLMERLMKLMQTQHPYLNPELKIEELAKAIEITPHQLSYVINEGFDENFFQFINKHRINRVKEMLLTDRLTKMSIMSIAYESGFNSKTAFNTTFKKFTNQTPSEFRKKGSHL